LKSKYAALCYKWHQKSAQWRCLAERRQQPHYLTPSSDGQYLSPFLTHEFLITII
jgi:hypothetical protein